MVQFASYFSSNKWPYYRKTALKTARDDEKKKKTHNSVNIFFKLLLKHLC